MKIFFQVLLVGLTTSFVTNYGWAQEADSTPAPTKRVGNISAGEKEKYRTRFEAKDSRMAALGPAFANNLNNSKMLYGFALGYEWEVGAQGGVIAEAEGSFGESTALLAGFLGGKYYFSDTDVSPVLKGGFGFGSSTGKDTESASGFAYKIAGGVSIFRTSTVHLEVLANYTSIMKTNERGNPGITSVMLGILY